MSFENYKEKAKTMEKRETLVSFFAKAYGYDFSLGVESGEGCGRAAINMQEKRIEAFATPKGIQKTCEILEPAVKNFFRGSGGLFRKKMEDYIGKDSAKK